MNYCELKFNPGIVELKDIPVLDYVEFIDQTVRLMKLPGVHCLNYFARKDDNSFSFYILLADDDNHSIYIYSHIIASGKQQLESISARIFPLHIFEREIHENYGIEFLNHPWLKPIRYPADRFDQKAKINGYPFYRIESEELHEVGVGPIHAGVIEPGHFRFICNGEQVLHLEIQLGYQHRGIEALLTGKKDLLKSSVLSENISGDTVAGHGLAYVQLMEIMAGLNNIPEALQMERLIALEMERIAMHIGDTAALCGDVAYQLGQATCEALRTLVINSLQDWCGNRFAKGFMRPGGTYYPLTANINDLLGNRIEEVHSRFMHIADCIYTSPGILARFEKTGTITNKQASLAGAVVMAARTTGIHRDIRTTHPFQYYSKMQYDPIIFESGDVFARGILRKHEIDLSYGVIRKLLKIHKELDHQNLSKPRYDLKLRPDSLGISMTEGWRGEICHICITDKDGDGVFYKVKDPSFHNWLMLALAVREQEISDFPLCNKSFNLSYCGNDL
jgi:Ni,Fe-hydrogenase III large subunit